MATTTPQASVAAPAPASRAYGAWVLVLLTLAYALSLLDRQVINILAESIKRDLAISDAQLGLLTGTAFGLFYTTLGIPIALLADRTHRVNVLTLSLLIWSVFTGLCGFAGSFTHLLLARLGVGVGEAGGTPASQSLLSDYFPYDRRATALAVLSMGMPLGTAIGFGFGGYLEGVVGWRNALLIAGVPGVVLAIIIKLTLREPLRGGSDTPTGDHGSIGQPSARATIAYLLRLPTFLRTVSGGACAVFMVYVSNAWLPPFFIRVYGMSVTEVGLWIGISVCIGGTIGVLSGGVIADRLKPHVPASELFVPALSTALTVAAMIGLLLSRDLAWALGFMIAVYLFGTVWMGPTSSIVQRVAPVRSRSLATGLQLLIGNMISLTVGPWLVGFLSDHFGQTMGAEGLRYALFCVPAVGALGILLYLSAVPHLVRDIEHDGVQ